MKLAALAAATLVAALLGSACSSSNIDNKEAVKTAIIDYLEKNKDTIGIDTKAMDVNVNAVAFDSDTARATVAFTVKGGTQGMQMNYTLKREGNAWAVQKKNDQTAKPHGIPDSTPTADPGKEPLLPVPLPGSSATQPLPAGHPPVNNTSPQK
ncbi:MAG: hypothetical protein ABI995_05290 [Acidobacteriota bacterium]